MGGQMSEDIRIGILVRTDMQRGGTMWRRKEDRGGPAYSFGSGLLEMSGGIRGLFANWEEVTWDGSRYQVVAK